MKKLAVLALAGLMFGTAALTFSMAPDVNDQALCNRNHVLCREYTLNLDAPWYKVMVLLTACDIAFGERVFGGAAKALEDQRKCSLDNFAYFHFEPEAEQAPLSPEWSLEKTHSEDLDIVRQWYKAFSGGLARRA